MHQTHGFFWERLLKGEKAAIHLGFALRLPYVLLKYLSNVA